MVREYCTGETFQASCGQNDIIVMEKANYGRMGIGKCVEEDLGYLGCFIDVLPKMDKECSGKSACDLLVIDSAFTSTNPCSKELKLYLEAGYHCARGTVVCVPVIQNL